ncbi:Acetolactate synthase isozyme 1 large subunit [Anatilimnocola aggregata]|uniref:Acetolactate synthase isozyme 1 large subunit n=1 Tax=Anatilimnocola aggregata TaxID=2528021 RepID=A0A517Y752_9BACT|nr:thiamine pyrophosphate-dependent enzyme [Anatilimnocola aggregata]QDU26061.1 Acetolactate synthase isozyme 1 large subunit [Anatilimnocola aggregata]
MKSQAKQRTEMPVLDALQVLIDHCTDWIVVTNQSSSRSWPKLVRRPLDLHYNPSTMGGAVSLALGLAIAQPQRRVLCVSGDGALLMNLGSLVTVVTCAPENLVVCVLDNEMYEVTGGQQLPAPRKKPLDYSALAKGVGFEFPMEFNDLADWQKMSKHFLSHAGPTFLTLTVGPTPIEYLKSPTPPMSEMLPQFRAALET